MLFTDTITLLSVSHQGDHKDSYLTSLLKKLFHRNIYIYTRASRRSGSFLGGLISNDSIHLSLAQTMPWPVHKRKQIAKFINKIFCMIGSSHSLPVVFSFCCGIAFYYPALLLFTVIGAKERGEKKKEEKFVQNASLFLSWGNA